MSVSGRWRGVGRRWERLTGGHVARGERVSDQLGLADTARRWFDLDVHQSVVARREVVGLWRLLLQQLLLVLLMGGEQVGFVETLEKGAGRVATDAQFELRLLIVHQCCAARGDVVVAQHPTTASTTPKSWSISKLTKIFTE